ncbi:class I SAM-dependent DNA methyltransferase [Stieleria varia]|uniref:site-specific DNA-methyltransferase (adenine-specific) n=1 Tax=Stieleria varia TaxID=2528005 RepID=A0A5C6ATH1_9BACT|nr:class I SAM-dependent DNA methyltransferase [Stieleria varia]TWU02868.1 Type I restriction enzyme EcoKI M protein [Stieleria varia]
MSEADSQKFLKDLDKKLWTAADRLRANLDAAVYKHAVLGLIFLKYVSDAFELRQRALEVQLRDPNHDYFVDSKGYSDDEYNEVVRQELEVRDYYLEENVFWVPALARWKTIQENAALPAGTEIEIVNGKKTTYKITSIGKLIDDALAAVEQDNPKLKGVLNKNYTQLQLPAESLTGLINLIAEIPFQHEDLDAKDILGHVYEYFLGQFALAEGKKGGQYYTPKSIVNLIVEMLEPFKGRVYDPAMGSGGFFVSSEKFIEQHGGKIGDVSVYGQESNPTTWRLAAMNMAIRGIDFNFGGQPANTFTNDLHPDLRADYVMANPPFNMKEWWDGKLEGDPRWEHGDPPKGNANFGWLQHMLYHLSPKGSMALLLANGSMSSNTGGEGEIRETIVKKDLVECMVALPGQLFTNTQIPACIWFLTKTKEKRGRGAAAFRDRAGEVLFIDARKLGYMVDRVLRAFTDEDTAKIVNTFHAWKRDKDAYEDVPGFCKSATLDEIAEHGFVLTPGRYVGAEDVVHDGVPFAEKMATLTRELADQFAESAKLEKAIRKNMKTLGFELPAGGKE